MRRRLPCLTLAFAAIAMLANAQNSKEAAERAEALRVADAWLSSVQAYQHIPAISAGVVAGDNLRIGRTCCLRTRQPQPSKRHKAVRREWNRLVSSKFSEGFDQFISMMTATSNFE